MRYLHLVEGIRPDLTLLDLELMTYGWYPIERKLSKLPEKPYIYHPIKGYNMHDLLEANPERTFYACTGLREDDHVWPTRLDLIPTGFCQEIIFKSQKPQKMEALPDKFTSFSWNYLPPHSSNFSDDSWEKVANDEMWAAKEKIALSLLNYAVKLKDVSRSQKILKQSYTIYEKIFDTHDDIPIYWYKNFGIVISRIHWSKEDRRIKIQKLVNYWDIYLKSDEGMEDNQASGMKDALKSYKNSLQVQS